MEMGSARSCRREGEEKAALARRRFEEARARVEAHVVSMRAINADGFHLVTTYGVDLLYWPSREKWVKCTANPKSRSRPCRGTPDQLINYLVRRENRALSQITESRALRSKAA